MPSEKHLLALDFTAQYKLFMRFVRSSPDLTDDDNDIIDNYFNHTVARRVKYLKAWTNTEHQNQFWIETKVALASELADDEDSVTAFLELWKNFNAQRQAAWEAYQNSLMPITPCVLAPSRMPFSSPSLPAEEKVTAEANRKWHKSIDFVDSESFEYVDATVAFSDRFLHKSQAYIEQAPFSTSEPDRTFPERKITYAYSCLAHLGLNAHLATEEKQALALTFVKHITTDWPEDATQRLVDALEANASTPACAYLKGLSKHLMAKPASLSLVKAPPEEKISAEEQQFHNPAPFYACTPARPDRASSSASDPKVIRTDSDISLIAAAETATETLAKAAATQSTGNAYSVLSVLSSAANAMIQGLFSLGNCLAFFNRSTAKSLAAAVSSHSKHVP